MNLESLLYYVAPVIGFFAVVIGIMAVLKPLPMSHKFGIPVRGEALPYVISTGIRDVFIGLTILTLFYLQQWVALGASCVFVGIVAVSDFLVVQKHGDKKTSIVHLVGAIGSVGYGLFLLLGNI